MELPQRKRLRVIRFRVWHGWVPSSLVSALSSRLPVLITRWFRLACQFLWTSQVRRGPRWSSGSTR